MGHLYHGYVKLPEGKIIEISKKHRFSCAESSHHIPSLRKAQVSSGLWKDRLGLGGWALFREGNYLDL